MNTYKSFQYNYDKKRVVNVDFDIFWDRGEKVVRNIKLSPNWRIHLPRNPRISKDIRGEYRFVEDGIWMTNGDIQQIIKRILQIVELHED